jgi:hypothetical protein
MFALSRSVRAALVAVSLLGALGGCVVEPARSVEIVAPQPPPALRVEVPPPAPAGRAEAVYWVPGRWHWDGREWLWRVGHYEERPFRRAEWVPGHWAERPNGGWVWAEGRWH